MVESPEVADELISQIEDMLREVSGHTVVSAADMENGLLDEVKKLYEFKNFCYVNEYISSTVDENQAGEKDMVNFTPIKISEIVDSDSLFPPKSTWITPRL